MKIFKIVLTLLAVIIISGGCGGSSSSRVSESEIDLLIASMTLREKVGQLFIIRPETLYNKITADELWQKIASKDADIQPVLTTLTDDMKASLVDYPAGGFAIFNQNIESPDQMRQLISDLKEASNITPFIAIDEEGGRVSRLANNPDFGLENVGSMQDIGSTGNTQNAYNAGANIGSYLSDYGFNLDFAPVADINTNPDNIVIGPRAFGSTPELVSKMVSAYLDGLHSKNILGTIKHFPGHGDTVNDTHSGYVAVTKTWPELLNLELIPFIENFAKTDLIMTAHITMKNVTSDDLPATLSKAILTDKLRDELGYDGVIITDSMEMGAIHDNYPNGEAAVMTIEAGVDIVLLPYDYCEAFDAVIKAVEDGKISESRINESVRRILSIKLKD
ncbi:MAG: hypothetical protein IJP48_01430 [Synergistaceae bacterium]|nr:hypothetical protein [Synergistaceae bacterium]